MKYLKKLINQKKIPGCSLYIYEHGQESLFYDGFAQLYPEKRPIKQNTLYDLASLTKIMATAPSIMKIYEEKIIDLDQPIDSLLDEFRNSLNSQVTIRQFLQHTSGFMPWYPMYTIDRNRRLEFLSNLKPDFEPGTDVQYSCLNYITLAILIERITGCTLKRFIKNNFLNPLRMENTDFGPADKDLAVTTEVGDRHERKMAETFVKDAFEWRDYPITGEVHDGNAYYCFGGMSGNAGLFSMIDDVIIFVKSLLNYSFPLAEKTIKIMEKPFKGRGLGWIIQEDSTLFHAGFTGCGIWLNRKEDYAVVFLSNLIHPSVVVGLGDQVRQNIIKTFRATRS